MNVVFKYKKTKEKVDKIVEAISTLEKANSSEISELTGISSWSVSDLIRKYVKEMYPDNLTVTARGYIWKKPECPPEIKAVPSKSNFYKNAEGYSDPTAGAAIRNMEKEEAKKEEKKYKTPISGEIWEFDRAQYLSKTPVNNLVYILSVAGSFVTGYEVRTTDTYYDGCWCYTIDIKNQKYYIDLRRIISKSTKAMVGRRSVLQESAVKDIKTRVLDILGVKPEVKEVPVEVEKIVEKRVEVPVEVEKVVEVPVVVDCDGLKLSKLTADLAMAEQRAEIWEEAFKALVNGKEDMK